SAAFRFARRCAVCSAVQRTRLGWGARDAGGRCAARSRVAREARGPRKCESLFHQLRQGPRLASRSRVAGRARGARGVPQPGRSAPRLFHRADPARRPCGRDTRFPLRTLHRARREHHPHRGQKIMKRTMIRYKVKADRVAENERYIARVFEQLRQTRPPGLRYASFKLDDGVSFVHIVSHEADDARNPLTELPAFKDFAAGIKERCTEPPVAVDLNEVGAYRFFGEESSTRS